MKFIMIIFVFAGCATNKSYIAGDQAPESIRKKFPPAATAPECRGANGNWVAIKNPAIFPNAGYCMFKTKDGGKRCHASAECEGYCEVSVSDFQEASLPRCSTFAPPRWDRCVPGYYENGKILGRGECFGDDSEVQ